MSAAASRTHPAAGFTLLEVMVVLALLALVTMIVAPNIGPASGGVQLHAASRDLAAALKRARSTAIVENREVRLGFESGGGAYRLDGAPRRLAADAGGGLRIELAAAGPGRTTPDATLAFYPHGGSSGGRIVLRRDGAVQAIDVDALTGRIAIAR